MSTPSRPRDRHDERRGDATGPRPSSGFGARSSAPPSCSGPAPATAAASSPCSPVADRPRGPADDRLVRRAAGRARPRPRARTLVAVVTAAIESTRPTWRWRARRSAPAPSGAARHTRRSGRARSTWLPRRPPPDARGPDRPRHLPRPRDGLTWWSPSTRSRYERLVTVAGRTRRVSRSPRTRCTSASRSTVSPTASTGSTASSCARLAGAGQLSLVATGDTVPPGQPVAVLESMKMVSTLTAPFYGQSDLAVDVVLPTPRSSAVHPCSGSVAASSDLLPDPPRTEAQASPSPPWPRTPRTGRPSRPRSSTTCATSCSASTWTRRRQGARTPTSARVAAQRPDDPALLAREDAFLDLFAEIGALYRPSTEAEAGDAGLARRSPAPRSSCSRSCSGSTPTARGLPASYRQRLRPGARRLRRPRPERPRPAGAGDVLWLFRSFSRVPAAAPFVMTVLQRRLASSPRQLPTVDAETRARLERLVGRDPGTAAAVTDRPATCSTTSSTSRS